MVKEEERTKRWRNDVDKGEEEEREKMERLTEVTRT